MKHITFMRKLVISLLVVTAVIFFILTMYPVEFLIPIHELFQELTIVCIIFLIIYLLIPYLRPKNVRPEDIFTGGASKPPYISSEELYAMKSIGKKYEKPR